MQRAGDVPCEAGPLEGGFIPGTYDREFLRKRFGVSFAGEGELRVFTEAMSPRYLKSSLTRAVVFLAMGFLAFVLGLRAMKRARR